MSPPSSTNAFPSSNTTSSQAHTTSLPTSATTQKRNYQYTHLHAQLAALNAHLADTENLLRMTGVQAENLRGLGGWWGGL